MLHCPVYDKLRHELWMSVWPLLPQNVVILNEEAQFATLLNADSKDVVKSVLKYIKRAMQLRRNVEKEKEEQEEVHKKKSQVRRARL